MRSINPSEQTNAWSMSTMLNKVPEITLFFWIIKILCTTVGETAADFLNVNLNFGLTGTSLVTGVLLACALVFQFRAKKYIPSMYWSTVALVSVFGTLVTDNLTDALGVPLEISTIIFSGLLFLTFLTWYWKEKTLSIHSIVTRQREVFYWLTILVTFALGTAAGDLMAEGLGLGYLVTGFIVAAVIVAISIAWRLGLNSILSFWIIYIMTRPLGASIGDYLSQAPDHGGLGLGASLTSLLFIIGIGVIVTYLSVTKRDVIEGAHQAKKTAEATEQNGLLHTLVVAGIFLIVGAIGYHIQQAGLQSEAGTDTSLTPIGTATVTTGTSSVGSTNQLSHTSPLGDLTLFRTIAADTLAKLNAGDQAGATARIDDLEYEWDNAQARLKPKSKSEWNTIDGLIDTVLRELRSTHPNATSEKAALEALITACGT